MTRINWLISVFWTFSWLLLFQCNADPKSLTLEREQSATVDNIDFDRTNLDVKKHQKKDKKAIKDHYQYPLAVAAIFQDEAPYLKEWIEYHKLIGVSHFYLYNNLSHDNYKEVLAPYIRLGEVDLIEWEYSSTCQSDWDQIQVSAYQDALSLARGYVKWLAFIDLDEFVVPILDDSLLQFLDNRCGAKDVGGICLMWCFFGTSNVEKIPEDKLLIETLVLHSGAAAGGKARDVWNQGSYKSIVRPDYVTTINSPHYAAYVSGRSHFMMDYKIIHINHYWTRDNSYLKEVKIPRRKIWGQEADSVMAWANGMNGSREGNPILKYIPALRYRMGLVTKPKPVTHWQ